jgi:hypothetical protein
MTVRLSTEFLQMVKNGRTSKLALLLQQDVQRVS